VEGGDNKARSLKFRVDARMRVDPAPEVAFDTILELTTGHYSIKPA
jgi:predicted component of type VI protein secretion system